MKRVRAVWQGVAGAPYYSNFYFDADGSGADAQAAASQVRAFLFGLSGAFDNNLTVNVDSDVFTINPATGLITASESTVTSTVVGTDTGEALPPFTQMVANWNTNAFIGGRRLRGRFFMPGLTETSNSVSGTPTTAFRDAFIAEVDDFLAGAEALCVWSRTHLSADSVEGYTLKSSWGVLRSRRD